MPRNVEIKARVDNLDALKTKVKNLAQEDGVNLEQEDTFFNVPNGRLKLRETNTGDNSLIQYGREDQTGPKLSTFFLVPAPEPSKLKTVLSKALGVKGVVQKSRLLVMVGQTKVHLDEVKGLGQFMELEVVLREDQTTEDGEVIAHELMEKLEISKESLIDCAYMDMILNDH